MFLYGSFIEYPMEIKAKTRLIAAIITIFILLGIGTVVYHHLEGWGYISSFYFSVVSVTTIGYGDLHPTSDVSRLFTAIYLLVGVATMLAALGIIGSAYIESREEQVVLWMRKMNLAKEAKERNRKLSHYKEEEQK